jgi:hypothetical protein
MNRKLLSTRRFYSSIAFTFVPFIPDFTPPLLLRVALLSLVPSFFLAFDKDFTTLDTCNEMNHAMNDPSNYMSVDNAGEVGDNEMRRLPV